MRFIIEEKNEGEVGQVVILKIGRGWVLTDLYVDPVHRGKGYSNRLMNKALSWADRRGLRLSLRVSPYGRGKLLPSWELVKFYERYGFATKGKRMIRFSQNERSEENDNDNEISEINRCGSGLTFYPTTKPLRKGKGS